jgi:hypothetical protein
MPILPCLNVVINSRSRSNVFRIFYNIFSDPLYQLVTVANLCAKEPRIIVFYGSVQRSSIKLFCLNVIRTLNLLIFSLIVYYDSLISQINTLVVIYAFYSLNS